MAQTKHRDDQLFVAPVEFDETVQHNAVVTHAQELIAAGGIDLTGSVSQALVPATSTITLSPALHDGKTVALDQADGVAVTLPAATGSGARYRLVVSVTVTSVGDIISAAGTDEFIGSLLAVLDNDTTVAWQAAVADDFDVITLNGGTTGGLIGDEVILEDIAAGVWQVSGRVVQLNATAATPFTST
jgi:hypothetical protein